MTTTNTSTLTITPTGDATGQDAPANGGGEGEPKAAAISFATDADFQRKVDDLLKERLEREQKKAEQKAQKAREDVLAEMAAKNGEWQQLAEQRAAKLTELEQQIATLDATTTKVQRYEQALAKQVEALRKDVPKHLAPLLDRLDVVEQLDWLANNRDVVAPKQPNGVPATPRAQGGLDAATQAEARQQAAGFYQDF
jgi:hypothetical protein